MAWRIPKDFDGAAFRERYPQLGEWDFTVRDGMLVLRDGVTLPDDPPIMDVVDVEKNARKERAKIIQASLGGKPTMELLMQWMIDTHNEINELRTALGKPVKLFDERKAAVNDRYVNGDGKKAK